MLGYFNILTSLIGLYAVCKRGGRLPNPVIPLILIPLIILFNYNAAYFGELKNTSNITYLIGITAFFISLLTCYRSYSINKAIDITLILFLSLILILSFLSVHAYFNSWDEFQFWGLALKSVFFTHQLPNFHTPINYKDYPLASTVFQYLALRANQNFNEPMAYLAQGILLLSPLLIVTCLQPPRKAIAAFITLIIILLCFEKSVLHRLLVDNLISTWFAGCILCYWFTRDDPKRVLYLIPGLCLLTLLKQAGIFFASLTLIYISLDIMTNKNNLKALAKQQRYLLLGSLTLAIICVSITVITWHHHYSQLAHANTFNFTKITIKNIVTEIFYSNNTTENLQIRNNFIKAFFFQGHELNRLHIPASILILINLMLSWMIAKRLSPTQKRRFYLLTTLLFLGFIGYSLYLLQLYLHVFWRYEALHLASFGRYLSIYCLAYTLITVGILAEHIAFYEKEQSKFIVIGYATLLVSLLMLSRPQGMHENVKQIYQNAEVILQQIPQQENSKLFLVYQNDHHDNGFAKLIYRYFLYPQITNECASLSTAYNDSDFSSCALSKNAWAAELQHYDYLYLAHTDNHFWHDYTKLLKLHGNTQENYLMKINSQHGKLKLSLMTHKQ